MVESSAFGPPHPKAERLQATVDVARYVSHLITYAYGRFFPRVILECCGGSQFTASGRQLEQDGHQGIVSRGGASSEAPGEERLVLDTVHDTNRSVVGMLRPLDSKRKY